MKILLVHDSGERTGEDKEQKAFSHLHMCCLLNAMSYTLI